MEDKIRLDSIPLKEIQFANEDVKNERKGYILMILHVIFIGLAHFLTKINIFIMPNYNTLLFTSIRFYFIAIFSYYFMTNKYYKLVEDKKNTVYFRSFLFFLTFYLIIICYKLLRFSTVISIIMICPVLTNVLAVLILKEPYKHRFIISSVICFGASLLICSNDRNMNQNNSESVESSAFYVIIGFILSFICAINSAYIQILSKQLSDIEPNYLNFQLGIHVGTFSLILSIFQNENFIRTFLNLKILLITILNSIFSYLAFNLVILSYKYCKVTKLTIYSYFVIILSMLLGYFFAGEMIFFSDFIGAIIIIGYSAYDLISSEDKK